LRRSCQELWILAKTLGMTVEHNRPRPVARTIDGRIKGQNTTNAGVRTTAFENCAEFRRGE
jgi:hypothetical protein